MGKQRRRLALVGGLSFVASAALWAGCGGSDFVEIGDTDAGVDGPGAADAPSGRDAPGAGDTGGGGDAGGHPDTGPGRDAGAGDAGRDGAGSGDSGSDAPAIDAPADSPIGVDAPPPIDSGTDAGCPSPTAGSVYVTPTGSDSSGNGSQACPFVTITKALSTTLAASGPTTIFVAAGSAGTPNVYGAGCTAGAGKCDATPIKVTDGMSKGIVIEGTSSDPTTVQVVSGTTAADNEVFLVNPANVGFRNMTIMPMRVAVTATGGRTQGTIGLHFVAPAVTSGSEAAVTNVIVQGIPKSQNSESTGSCIAMQNGTSPTVGPGVTLVGGDHSVLVTQNANTAAAGASSPTITSSTALPSFFHDSQFACVRVESANASATAMPSASLTATVTTDPGRLHLQNCGGNGGVVVDTVKFNSAVDVENTRIDSTGNGAAAYYGVRLQHAGSARLRGGIDISGINEVSAGVGAGVEAVDTASLEIDPGVNVTKNVANGVHIGGSATAGIDGVMSTGNRNGLLCNAGGPVAGTTPNLTMKDSVFLANRETGVTIAGGSSVGASCNANLGANGSGNNTFNVTSQANGTVGLCYTSLVAATVASSTWACGLVSGTPCTAAATPSAPTPVVITGCQNAGDYSQSAMLTVALPQTCCGM